MRLTRDMRGGVLGGFILGGFFEIHQAYSSMCDFGGRGVPPDSGVSADFDAGLSGRGSGRCRPSLSSLEERRSAIGSAGKRPELLKRSTSLIA
jgi:hypothetical protein